jgi:hypothetical protein
MNLVNTLCLSHLICFDALLPVAGKASPMSIIFAESFINQDLCFKILCLLCFMLPAGRLQFMTTLLSSVGFYFHVLVDLCFNVSFPHIFSVLHPYSIETS